MITESMAAALVDAAFDSIGELVREGIRERRANACWRQQKWRALIEMTNEYRSSIGKKPRVQPLRNLWRIQAGAMCTANKATCRMIDDAVTRKLAEAKDRIAKGDLAGLARFA